MGRDTHDKQGKNFYRKLLPNVVCEGKIGYASKAKAMDRLRHQAKGHRFRRSTKTKRTVTAYHCPVCGQWHVGSTTETYAKQFKQRRAETRVERAERQIREAWERHGHK